MKFFLPCVPVLLALHCAEAGAVEPRTLRHGTGGDMPGRLQNMVDTECPTFDCDAVATDETNCTFEKPERPNVAGLTEDQIAELKAEMQATRQEMRQDMLRCACCEGMSVEDILAAKGESKGSRPFGGGGFGRPGRGGSSGAPDMGGGSHFQGSAGDDSNSGDGRGLGRQGGRGGGKPGRLQNMVDTECPTFDCNAVATDETDCTFEKPERPDVTGLTEDQIADLKAEMQATREDMRNNMLRCACCEGMSVEEILAAKGEGEGSRPFGGGGSGRPGRGDGPKRPSTGGALGRGPRIQGSDNDSTSGDGSSGDGSSFSNGSDSGDSDYGDVSSGGLVKGMSCDAFDCGSVEPESVDCNIFDSTNGNTRGRRRNNRLYCGCCRD